MFLPPEEPDLSPIELCWSKFPNFGPTDEALTPEQLEIAIS